MLFKSFLLTLSAVSISLFSQAQVYGEEIISWDFSDGIPSDWENFTSSGISTWEYRAESTDPDNNIGSRGSCGSSSLPIQSTSSENGFVIFDSNYWDDEVGPCGNIGSGLDPGPHLAQLTTSSIDLTGETSLVLTFQQQFKNYQCETTVSISTDGGENFTSIFDNPTQTGLYSGDVSFASVNISELAGNQSDVRIKFEFTGLYYYWMLDDIVIYQPNDNDLFLTDARYTSFDFNQGPTGIGNMEYTMYPSELIQPFQFFGDVLNIGNNVQTNATLTTEIWNENDELINSISGTPSSVGIGMSSILNTNTYFPPSVLGKYKMDISVHQNEADENLDNNALQKEFEITNYTWGRDNWEMEGEYNHSAQYAEVEFKQGNYFESLDQGEFMCSSISVAFSDSTQIGALAYVQIYDYSRETILGESVPYEINAWDLNSIGESKFVTIQLEEPVILQDSLYLAVCGSTEELGRVRIATSGDSPANTSMLIYPTQNDLYYTLATPMIRMNMFSLDQVPGCTNEEANNYNALADTDDGSCRIEGCIYPNSEDYNPEANFFDGSCGEPGCLDPEADNYNPEAQVNDLDLCIYLGCTNPEATNYDETANEEDGSCLFSEATLSISETSGCVPFTLNIINQTEILENGTCLIDLGDETIQADCGNTNFDHTYINSGEYQITYTYSVGEFISEFIETITVLEAPETPEITYDFDNNQLECMNCDDSNTYNWYLEGELILEDAPTVIINPELGNYTLEVNNGSNCSAESEEYLHTTIEELSGTELNIYPNPFNEFITIELTNSESDIIIFDLYGKEVLNARLLGKGSHTINVSRLPRGAYFIQAIGPNYSTSKKLIKH